MEMVDPPTPMSSLARNAERNLNLNDSPRAHSSPPKKIGGRRRRAERFDPYVDPNASKKLPDPTKEQENRDPNIPTESLQKKFSARGVSFSYKNQSKATKTLAKAKSVANHNPEEKKRPLRKAKSMAETPTYLKYTHILPLDNENCEHFAGVTPHTVVEALQGRYKKHYRELYIIDARFPYEYDGGHIESAINLHTEEMARDYFFDKPLEGVCIILHCEFSSHRGPKMYNDIRKWDRKEHETCWPSLFYPELYVMTGGYRAFFNAFSGHCDPKCYVGMYHEEHKDDMKTLLKPLQKRRSRSRSDRSRSCGDLSAVMKTKAYSPPQSPTRRRALSPARTVRSALQFSPQKCAKRHATCNDLTLLLSKVADSDDELDDIGDLDEENDDPCDMTN